MANYHNPFTAMDTSESDSAQQAAVQHRGSNLLIIAGAGSGKTRTLAHRAVSLLNDLSPQQMMVVTFTKKAAADIQQRIKDSTTRNLEALWIGTFHSICRRILLENEALVGLVPGWGILDAKDSIRVMRAGATRTGLDIEEVQKLYSFARNSMQDWRELLGSTRFPKLNKSHLSSLERVIGNYERRCQRSGRVDFDDLQRLVVQILEKHPDIRTAYRRRFRAILVDEYQDTNLIQAKILELLALENNITVVGDDSQSIYSFRAARVDNILEFDRQFPPATVIQLQTNYRSTPEIVALANESINHNKQKYEKDISSFRSSGMKPQLIQKDTPREETAYVISAIEALIEHGEKLSDIAILFRARRLAAEIELDLKRLGLPFVVYGGEDFFELDHVKSVLDFARLLVMPEDTIALSSIRELTGFIESGLLEEIELKADRNDLPFWGAVDETLPAIRLKNPDQAGRFATFIKGLRSMRKLAQPGESITDVMVAVIDVLEPFLRKKHEVMWETVEDDLQVLVNIASSYSNLSDFLALVSLDEFVEDDPPEHPQYGKERLVLSTVHSAKGLEWNTVFIIGLVDFWYPMSYAVRDYGSDEEERRLFYVAVTRAKNQLYLLSYQKSLDRYGRSHQQSLSRFLGELDPRLFVKSNQPVSPHNITTPSVQPAEQSTIRYGTAQQRKWQCPVCKGQGYISSHNEYIGEHLDNCHYCEGKGKVTISELIYCLRDRDHTVANSAAEVLDSIGTPQAIRAVNAWRANKNQDEYENNTLIERDFETIQRQLQNTSTALHQETKKPFNRNINHSTSIAGVNTNEENTRKTQGEFFVDVRDDKRYQMLVAQLAKYGIHVAVHLSEIRDLTGYDDEGCTAAYCNAKLIVVGAGRPVYNIPTLGMLTQVAVKHAAGLDRIAGRITRSIDRETNGVIHKLLWYGPNKNNYRDPDTIQSVEIMDKNGVFPNGIRVPFTSTERKTDIDVYIRERLFDNEKCIMSLITVSRSPSINDRIVDEYCINLTETGPASTYVVNDQPRDTGIRRAFTWYNHKILTAGKSPRLCIALPDDTRAFLSTDHEIQRLIQAAGNTRKAKNRCQVWDAISDYLDGNGLSLFDEKKKSDVSMGGYAEILLALSYGQVWLANPPSWSIRHMANLLLTWERTLDDNRSSAVTLHKILSEVDMLEEVNAGILELE